MTTARRLSVQTVFVILAAAVAFGCAPKHKETSEDKVVTAYKLIDAGREEEAIIVLEGELKNLRQGSPEHNRLTVVMASAYAHRAGVRVQKFVKIMEAGKHKVKFDVPVTLSNNPKVEKVEAVDKFLAGVATFVASASNVSAVYAAVPTIKAEDEKYLDFAVRLMDGVDGDSITQGDALYRAVIKTIYLKHFIATHMIGSQLSAELSEASCTVDFDKIATSLKTVGKYLIEILDDMGRAQPKKAKDFQKQQYKVSVAVGDLTGISTSVSLLDETTMRFAKLTLIATGLQNLLKCTANTATASSSAASPLASALAESL